MSTITRAKVLSHKSFNKELFELILKPDKYRRFEAGQFLNLTLSEVSASSIWPESRAFSIASYNREDKTMRLIIKNNGGYTKTIQESINVGDSVYIKYAYGDFIIDDNFEGKIICIAGGVGITPFLSFIDYLENINKSSKMELHYSVRKVEDIVLTSSDVIRFVKDGAFNLYITGESEALGENFINQRFVRYCRLDVSELEIDMDALYYVSGSKEFMDDIIFNLHAYGVSNILTDEW